MVRDLLYIHAIEKLMSVFSSKASTPMYEGLESCDEVEISEE